MSFPQICDMCLGSIRPDDDEIEGKDDGLLFCSDDCFDDFYWSKAGMGKKY